MLKRLVKSASSKCVIYKEWYLTQDGAVLAANALFSSRLDYCSSLSVYCGSARSSWIVFRLLLHVLSQIIQSMIMLHPPLIRVSTGADWSVATSLLVVRMNVYIVC